jgi:hypothetical protein
MFFKTHRNNEASNCAINFQIVFKPTKFPYSNKHNSIKNQNQQNQNNIENKFICTILFRSNLQAALSSFVLIFHYHIICKSVFY